MAPTDTPSAVSIRMSRIKGSGSKIERVLGSALWRAGVRYRKQYKAVPGRPDFAVVYARIAIFCDSSFWHGRGWPNASEAFRTNRDFWVPKIESNIRRDAEVNALLVQRGWVVVRFWDDDILKRTDECVAKVLRAIEQRPAINDPNGSD